MRGLRMVVPLLALIVAPGCGSDDDGDPTLIVTPTDGGTIDDGGMSAASGPVAVGTGGGRLVSDDGQLTLEIPAGALRAPLKIRIAAAPMSVVGAAGPLYEITPPGTTLAKKARVTVRHGGVDLKGAAASDLAIAFHDEGRWTNLDDRAYDSAARAVSGSMERLDAIALVTGLCVACTSTCDPATCRFGAEMDGTGGVLGRCVAFGNGCGRCVPTCDGDGDGYCPGSPANRQPGNDCNDSDARIYPRALEICGNAIDDDCDGHVDEGCTACADDAECAAGFQACINGRCDVCQNGCNPATCAFGADRNVPGSGVPGRCHAFGRSCTRCVPSCDADGDGACPGDPGMGQQGGDCDDNNPRISRAAAEVCGNGLDDNCDGNIDEGCDRCGDDSACTRPNQACVGGVCEACPSTCTDGACRFGADAMGNGGTAGKCVAFGNGCGRCIPVCDSDADGFCPGNPGGGQPGGDCNDGDPDVNPKRQEICGKGIDDNCNNHVDEGCKSCTSDADCSGGLLACIEGKCQVCSASCNPDRCRFGEQSGMPGSGVAGRCSAFGNGCSVCIPACDLDGDGYCPGQPGMGQPGGDCNDADKNIHPRGREVCGNGVDDDCDGQIDQGCTTCASATMCGSSQSCGLR